MPETDSHPPQAGRILSEDERVARIADEHAGDIQGEPRRSAFAISGKYVLTAWHCVREEVYSDVPLWLRLRCQDREQRHYKYVPLRITNYDESLDVAALTVDTRRLSHADLSRGGASSLLAEAAIPLGTGVHVGDKVQVLGFPASATAADSDANVAEIAEVTLPLGNVTGLKLYCPALAAIDPVDPHGLSGGPVIKYLPGGSHRVVAMVRAAPSGKSAGTASGGGLIATLIGDMAVALPEVAVTLDRSRETADRPAKATSMAPLTGSALAAGQSCLAALASSLITAEDPERGPLLGWSHFLDEPITPRRPTAIGTAYGLKLLLSLDARDGRINRGALVETLWRLQVPEGRGWSARTGSGISRPEVTSLVLGALAGAGAGATDQRFGDAAAAFEESLAEPLDPVGMSRTYVVTAAMRGLIQALPQSRRLRELRSILLAGAIEDPGAGSLLCWPASWMAKHGQTFTPSVAHTAMAIEALARSCKVLGDDATTRSALTQGLTWLVTRNGLEDQGEQIRRFVTDNHWDSLTLNFFTAAWVARALLATDGPGDPRAQDLLRRAVQRVWATQHNGIWEWSGNDRPIWMTYQGLRVIRDYTMRAWPA